MWTTLTRRQLGAEVPASPDEVREFYCELRNMVHVHPLVVAVQCIEHREGPDGDFRDYRIDDRIPFGPLRLAVRYRASVLLGPDGVARTEARQFPAVRLAGTVTFVPVASGTAITEIVDISAPRPIARFTVDQAVAAHTAMLRRIGDYFTPA